MSKKYHVHQPYHPTRKRSKALLIIGIVAVIIVVMTLIVRQVYQTNLQPVSGSTVTQQVTIPRGADVDQIAKILNDEKLLKSDWAFKLYIHSQDASSVLQAGTYALRPNMTVNELVAVITRGKVVTDLITILPGQTLAQVRETFINAGFEPAEVDEALQASNYPDAPILVDKPASASLEGFLWPDSYQKDSSTRPETIVEASLNEMQQHLTTAVRNEFAAQGLSTYQGLILASLVEREVAKNADRPIVAQVFLKRLRIGTPLGSDPTANYGADLENQRRSVDFDTPYNTRKYVGLPPTPISSVSDSALDAVGSPAETDWLFFVSGDDGTTHFSNTIEEHEAATRQYCTKLCQ